MTPRPRCFECGKASTRKHYVVPKARGGTQTVPLCAHCYELVQVTRSSIVRDDLAKAKARGVKLGGPTLPVDQLALRVKAMKVSGMSRQAIANVLNAEGVPTLRDAPQWTANTVRGLLERRALRPPTGDDSAD